MPDIGLLQGAPPRRRETTSLVPEVPQAGSEASREEGAAARSGEPAGGIAVKFSAPVERAIQVQVVSEAAPGERVVEPLAGPAIGQVAHHVIERVAVPAPASALERQVAEMHSIPVPNAMTEPHSAAPPPVALAAPPVEPASPLARAPVDIPPAARTTPPPIRWQDLLWLALALVVIIGTGIGSRDPWPADEPRFAAVARDMVATGEWLFPRVGGDLYQDKPPLFFWMLAVCYTFIGSLMWSFLVPGFLAAGGTLFCIYDLGRRLVSREAGLAAQGPQPEPQILEQGGHVLRRRCRAVQG